MGRTIDFEEAIDQIRDDTRASAPKQIPRPMLTHVCRMNDELSSEGIELGALVFQRSVVMWDASGLRVRHRTSRLSQSLRVSTTPMTLPILEPILVGLAVTAYNNVTMNTSAFNHIPNGQLAADEVVPELEIGGEQHRFADEGKARE